jgi:thiamine-monophosphate kinase
VAGGDTSSAELVLLAITALGDLAGREPVTRAGARPGDVLALAGRLGSAAAGLALLQAGVLPGHAGPDLAGSGLAGPDAADPDAADPDAADPDLADPDLANPDLANPDLANPDLAGPDLAGPDLVSPDLAGLALAHSRPRPPYAAGPQAAALGATAMIDISDGLIADLRHIAAASGVRIELQSARLGAEPVASAGPLRAAASLLGRDWLEWVLTGGDDHALAATFPAKTVLPDPWTAIGTVTDGSDVLVDNQVWIDPAGWEHFRH